LSKKVLGLYKFIIFTFAIFFFTDSILGFTHNVPPQFPSISLQENSRRQIIEKMIEQVDIQNWYQIISDLSENEDLDNPNHFYHSRYSLRVSDAQQFDGKPEPDDACDNAAEYIANKFRSYGLEVENDLFEHKIVSINGKTKGIYKMRNVIATLPGKGNNKEKYFLITAHYDSIASKTEGWEENWRTLPAPGAVDNASGVAGIIEAARILSQQDLDFTVKFVAFSGEEIGLFGSKHFAKLAKENDYPILGVINFDMIGHDTDGILDLHVVGNKSSEWLVNAFRKTRQVYNIELDFHKIIDSEFVYSDHSPFWENGFSAIMVSEESSFESQEWPEFIHSGKDTLDKLNLDIGERAVKLAIATIAELAEPITVSSIDEYNSDLAWYSSQLGIPEQISSNQPISVSAEIENKIEVDVEDIEVRILAIDLNGNSEVVLSENFDLSANKRHKLSGSFVIDGWGTYTIWAVINPEFSIIESNFSNNIIEKQIVVSDNNLLLKNIVAYPNPLNLESDNGELYLAYKISKDANVFVKLYSIIGELIWTKEFLIGQKGGKLGQNRDIPVWNGKNEHGETVSAGVYFCHVSIEDIHGDIIGKTLKIAVIK